VHASNPFAKLMRLDNNPPGDLVKPFGGVDPVLEGFLCFLF
jgi:hypothetical protein